MRRATLHSWRQRRRPGAVRRASGFTLVEAAMCTVLVGVTFVAAMHGVGLASRMQLHGAERARARALAAALLEEAMQQKYASASPSPVYDLLLGGAVVSGSGGRLGFDDLDDYHDYTDSPPVHRDGSPVAGGAGYARHVLVRRVNPQDLSQPAADDSGVKLISVTVSRGGKPLARLSGVRTHVP